MSILRSIRDGGVKLKHGLLLMVLFWPAVGFSIENNRPSTNIIDNNFIYTPALMLGFDLSGYLDKNLPHLSPFAEVISHWSGYSSISPMVIITFLELETTANLEEETEAELPTHDADNHTTVALRIEAIATTIANSYYRLVSEGRTNPIQGALAEALQQQAKRTEYGTESRDKELEQLQSLYSALFSKLELPESWAKQGSVQQSKTLPSVSLLQLPYPIGEAWETWGGSHSFRGDGNATRSSLDFRLGRLPWGADTSAIWVAAANAGQFIRHSSCFAEVISPNGWSTNYYHLDNIRFTNGQTIARNSAIANYADSLNQSLCNGGHSNGPHVHFSLKNQGIYHSLDGVVLSGHKVHDGRRDYDTNCNFYWMDDGDRKVCAGTPLRNNGVPSAPQTQPQPDMRIQSLAVSPNKVLTGGTFKLNTTVYNQGTLPATQGSLVYLASTDAQLSLADTVLSTVPLTTVSPGTGFNMPLAELSVASLTGTIWLGVCITNIEGEINLANNCATTSPVKIVSQVPLTGAIKLLLMEDD